MRVFALESGRVVDIEKKPIYGIIVTIETKRTVNIINQIKYCFLDWTGVRIGDIINPGQLIGTIPDERWSEEEEEE